MNASRFLNFATALTLCSGLAWATLGAPPATAETWSNVTVVTVDGWEYKSLLVESDAGEANVTLVNADGGRKRMPRSSIQVIRDCDGRDITAVVLSGKERAARDVSRSDTVRVADPQVVRPGQEDTAAPAIVPRKVSSGITYPSLGMELRGPRFRFSSSFALGTSSVSGDWFDGLTSGLSGDITARIATGANSHLGLSYRYQRLEVDPELREPIVIEDGYGRQIVATPKWDVDLREMFFLMGAMTKPRTYAIPALYFEVGVGAIQHNFGLTLTLPDGRSSSADTHETKFAMLVGVGTLVPLGRSIGLDLGGSVRVTGDNLGSSGTYASARRTTGILYGGRLGLAFLFGG